MTALAAGLSVLVFFIALYFVRVGLIRIGRYIFFGGVLLVVSATVIVYKWSENKIRILSQHSKPAIKIQKKKSAPAPKPLPPETDQEWLEKKSTVLWNNIKTLSDEKPILETQENFLDAYPRIHNDIKKQTSYVIFLNNHLNKIQILYINSFGIFELISARFPERRKIYRKFRQIDTIDRPINIVDSIYYQTKMEEYKLYEDKRFSSGDIAPLINYCKTFQSTRSIQLNQMYLELIGNFVNPGNPHEN